MSGEPLLCDDRAGIASCAAKMLELSVESIALVLVISLGRRAMELRYNVRYRVFCTLTLYTYRRDTNVIDRQAPDSESTTQRRDIRVAAVEHAISGSCISLLTLSLFLDILEPSTVFLEAQRRGLLIEIGDLVVKPFGDLLAAECQLTLAISDIEAARRYILAELTGRRQDTSTWSRD